MVPGLEKSLSVAMFCFVLFFQFNYMHECFERVFCELKWRKEVILNNLELTVAPLFVYNVQASGQIPGTLTSVSVSLGPLTP